MIKEALQQFKRSLTIPRDLTIDSVKPVSSCFGMDRGLPIDRFFIEDFLEVNKELIQGTVLEIADSTYTKRFGSNINSFQVLHATSDNSKATIVGDLTDPGTLPSDTMDCFICTQTLSFIYNFKEAIAGCYQLLKPGGSILATVPCISQISRYDMDRWGDYWRFTPLSARKAFEEVFESAKTKVDYYGNSYAAINFLRGIACEEIDTEKLKYKDENYPVTITVIATK